MANKKIRLERILSNLGYGARRECAAAIKAGAFKIDGTEYRDPSETFDPSSFINPTFDDAPLDPISPLTILLHKPRGYTCSSDEDGDLVYDLLPARWKRRVPILSCAGRLDKDSTGLVLMTDDGQLLHRVISPKTHAQKHYRVTLRDDLNGDEAALFKSGEFYLRNDPKPLKPAMWEPLDKREGIMILSEGRYHQIRRMFGSMGNHVESLHRFRIGEWDIGDLDEGAWKPLS